VNVRVAAAADRHTLWILGPDTLLQIQREDVMQLARGWPLARCMRVERAWGDGE